MQAGLPGSRGRARGGRGRQWLEDQFLESPSSTEASQGPPYMGGNLQKLVSCANEGEKDVKGGTLTAQTAWIKPCYSGRKYED